MGEVGDGPEVLTRGGVPDTPREKAEVGKFRELTGQKAGGVPSAKDMRLVTERARAERQAALRSPESLRQEADREERLFGSDSPRARALREQADKGSRR